MRSRTINTLPVFSLHAIAVLTPLLLLAGATPARASFHLIEISKVMVGLNGNSTIQAVELKMLAGGQTAVTGGSIKVYEAAGTFVATLGTLPGPVASGITGRRILCATHNFAVTFGITPDLVISPGLLIGTGQVSFEVSSCLVNALAYGTVTSPKNGTTSAAALSADGADALVRSIDNGISPFCPLAEDASARFQVVSGTSLAPITFTNNAAVGVTVFPTAAGVEESPVVPTGIRVYPNPFSTGATIEAPVGSEVAIYDVSGRRVRSWSFGSASFGASSLRRIDWDGTDFERHRLPSGIYFVQIGESARNRIRVALLR